MTARDRDPAAMTPAERRAEIAGILAAGYLRLLAARLGARRALDGSGRREAQCGPGAHRPGDDEDAA